MPAVPAADPIEGDVHTADLATRLRSTVTDQLADLFTSHAPGGRLPGVFAGHRVGPDVHADLAFTLGFLHAAGVAAVGDVALEPLVATLVTGIDGRRTHTFYSYRIAETVLRWGPLDGNPLLADAAHHERDAVVEAVDSTEWVELLPVLPANYAAVLARCELARAALGLTVDDELVADLLARTERLLTTNPAGYLDDTPGGEATRGRYDIYTVDVYLFTEPFADRLGGAWSPGATNAASLALATTAGNGACITWGRSTGVLALAHTIELAALAARRPELGQPVDRWLALAAAALDHLPSWFSQGVIRAHQHRSTDRYRGPDRRLQLTLDVLGKLAWAALELDGASPEARTVPAATGTAAWPARDELRPFTADGRAGVWTYRSERLAFVLPLVGPAWSDYLAAPRLPGLFEVPADADLPTGVVSAFVGASHYVGAGVPVAVEHDPDQSELRATYDGLPEADGPEQPGRRSLAAKRSVTWRVDGRTLHGQEHLRFPDRVPDALALQLTEAAGRPLRVEAGAGAAHRLDVIDTAGMAENRSAWGELPRVHQLDVTPAAEVDLWWSVTPLLRVATDAVTHHYHRSLYDPIRADVVDTAFHRGLLDDERRAERRLADVDVFHLHWPEWLLGADPELARRFVALLDRCRVRLVWTQHNLVPHHDDPHHDELYRIIAAAADAVLHHSRWGEERARARWPYRPDCRHRLVPHGHFGNLMPPTPADRAATEAELGLPPATIRLGIVGAPRRAKQVEAFMAAFARSSRPDVGLLVLSLAPGDEVPDDPRITALPYEFVDRATYDRRLAAIDVLVLPFDPTGEMLTTGVVGDVLGSGIPALCSSWPFLAEVLGHAALRYDSLDEVPAMVDGLDTDAVGQLSAATIAERDRYDWEVLAPQVLAVLDEVGTAKL